MSAQRYLRIRRVAAAEVSHPHLVQFGQKLTAVQLPPQGLPSYEDIVEELIGYTDILLGRTPSPVTSPYLSLAEVAAAYYSRAREIEMLIFDGEQSGVYPRGSDMQKLRTGRLEAFIRMTGRLYDLGSRRLSQEALITQQRIDMGETQ